MDNATHNALQSCVGSLRSSMQLLGTSINTLDAGVNDYPRLCKVVQTIKHFELVSEHDLTNAQAALASEIQPEIQTLLARVEGQLDKLERRERSLMAKADLQEGRLAQPAMRRTPASPKANSAVLAPRLGSGASLEELKLQQLRQKKERLSYAVARLEMQSGQRQRQLRKSMAAQ